MGESNFPSMLKYLRRSRGYTQETLAKATGLNRSTIANYESGNRNPELETLELLADFFKVSISTLLGRSEDFRLPEDTLTQAQKMLYMSLQGASDAEIAQAVKIINAIRE